MTTKSLVYEYSSLHKLRSAFVAARDSSRRAWQMIAT
jgi:hypothetical protein